MEELSNLLARFWIDWLRLYRAWTFRPLERIEQKLPIFQRGLPEQPRSGLESCFVGKVGIDLAEQSVERTSSSLTFRPATFAFMPRLE